MLVCGLGMVIGFVVTEADDYALRTHGTRTVATVEDQQGTGRDTSYLLDFSDRDGTRDAALRVVRRRVGRHQGR